MKQELIFKEEFMTHSQIVANDCFSFYYVLEGNLMIKGFEGERLIYPHQLFILNPYDCYSFHPSTNHVLLLSIEYRPQSKIAQAVRYDVLLNSQDKDAIRIQYMNTYISYFRRQYSESHTQFNHFIRMMNMDESFYHSKILEDDRYRIVSEIISDLRGRKESLSEMSLAHYAVCYDLNYHYLSRFFKSYVGYTFTECLRFLRLQVASNTMLRTDESITEVCYQSGYADPKGMNRDFKAVYELTPTEYRSHYSHLSRRIQTDFLLVKLKEEKSHLLLNQMKKKESVRKHYRVTIQENPRYYQQSFYAPIIEAYDYFKMTDYSHRDKEIIFYVRPFDRNLNVFDSENAQEPFSDQNLCKNYEIDCPSKIHLFFQVDWQTLSDFSKQETYLILLRRFLQKWVFLLGRSEFSKIHCVLSLSDVFLMPMSISQESLIYNFFSIFKQEVQDQLGFPTKVDLDIGEIDLDFELLEKWKRSCPLILNTKKMNVFLCLRLRKNANKYPKEENIINFLEGLAQVLPNEHRYILSFNLWSKEDFNEPFYMHRSSLNLYFFTLLLKMPSQFELLKWSMERHNECYHQRFCDEHGMLDSIYYFKIFLQKFQSNVVFKQDGCLVSKNGYDLYCLLYSDYRSIPFDVSSGEISSAQEATIFLELHGIEGQYRISEYRLNFEKLSEVSEMLYPLNPLELRLYEKQLLKAKILPDLQIIQKELSGKYYYKCPMKILDLVLLKLEKIA